MIYSWQQVMLLAALAAASVRSLNITSPEESLYDVTLHISDTSQCTLKDYKSLCTTLQTLRYKQCELLTKACNREARLRVSFSSYILQETVAGVTNNLKSHRGITIEKGDVADVNECTDKINSCSKNGYCINTLGTYRCQCGFGYQEARTPMAQPGTYCVSRCNRRSCRNEGVCVAGADEDTEVTCQCQTGYTGDSCQQASSVKTLPNWGIYLIASVAGVSAVIGIILCVYACYRLFYKRNVSDNESDVSSISGFKPRAIPSLEYDRFTDLGSMSRANRGFYDSIDEEPERGSPLKPDRHKFDTQLSRFSVPSEHGDPTPPLEPISQTDRHAVADIISRP